MQPGLAEKWEVPDAVTYIFHLHHGVTFHDGRPLTSRDVKWTLDSLLRVRFAAPRLPLSLRRHVDAPDDSTVIVHLKEPFGSLLWNLSEGAIGIVPFGSLDEIARHHRLRPIQVRSRRAG